MNPCFLIALSTVISLPFPWTFETWQLGFALLVIGSDCPGRDPEPAHHMQWDILCISFRALGSQVSTKEIGFGNSSLSSRVNAWIFLFLTWFSISSRGFFNLFFFSWLVEERLPCFAVSFPSSLASCFWMSGVFPCPLPSNPFRKFPG